MGSVVVEWPVKNTWWITTRAVFDRYHIVSPADLKDRAQKLAGAKRLGVKP